jgi:hypothetical protein
MKCMFIVAVEAERLPNDPCMPSPCGANSHCQSRNGIAACTCVQGFSGDPYFSCRPECVLNSDCPWGKACKNNKCVNPCSDACGANAECSVAHHTPYCTCLESYTGNPLISCKKIVHEPSKNISCFKLFSIFMYKNKFVYLHVFFVHILFCFSM